MSRVKCPVCKNDKCYDAPYTNVICTKCGSLLNNTPFGIELVEKHKHKWDVKQWKKQEEIDKLIIGVNIE